MNKYPSWWNSTLTLYNRYEDPQTQEITWQRTVLKNCFWKIHYNSDFNNGDKSVISNPIVVCRVPKSAKFVDVYTWKSLSANNRASKFTFQSNDIIIKGNVTDSINEYVKGSRASDLVDKYKDRGVIRLSLFVDNSDDTRNIQHYYVR